MSIAIAPKDIRDELQSLKQELGFLKEHMVDVDSIMTEEDYETLLNYREEKRRKQLVSHEQLKKELGL